MIEGLQIDVTTTELRAHLTERAAYHRERAEWYDSQITSLQAGGVENSYSNNPVHALEESRKKHEEKAAYFAFMSEHLIEEETYRLSQADLGEIELASRYFPGVRF